MQRRSDEQAAKPVVALMGEFSAGKSTLANLLIDEGRSPVRVTATRMPPIWYTHGDGDTVRVALDGTLSVISDDEDLDQVSVEDTAFIQMQCQAEVLELIDIIDMPGISDPNLSSDSWKGTLTNADIVVWCSHATQAWRQSEAATWNEIPEHLWENGLLLLTRYDKLLTEGDKKKVMKRVEAETEGLFRGVFPISLIEAETAGEDRSAWEHSGAEKFMQALLDTVFALSRPSASKSKVATASDSSKPLNAMTSATNAPTKTMQDASSKSIVPKRVSSNKGIVSVRPPKSSNQEMWF